jgi:hypothetical protein
MTTIIDVTNVEPLAGSVLRVTFSDGAIKEVDLSALISSATGVFKSLRDRAFFQRVRVNNETGTIEWPGEVDFDSEVLYGKFEPASGARITRRTIRPPRETVN